MGENVHPRVGGDGGGDGDHQLRVQDGHRGLEGLVGEGVLDPLLRVGDDGVVRHLAASAAGGGDGEGLPDLPHPRGVGRHGPDRLGRVDGASAAQGDHHIGAAGQQGLYAADHVGDGRVGHHVGVDGDLAVGEVGCDPVGDPGGDHKLVRHQKDPAPLHLAQPGQSALAEIDPCAEAEFFHMPHLDLSSLFIESFLLFHYSGRGGAGQEKSPAGGKFGPAWNKLLPLRRLRGTIRQFGKTRRPGGQSPGAAPIKRSG